ncbi:MAG: TolC family protein [Marinilabiliaceae bacterium]|nr:TolC family protein [Marinilabiliaceae bacterium]
MRQIGFILFVCLAGIMPEGKAQSLSLDDCLLLSRENYPLQSEFSNVKQQTELRLKNLHARYYPTMDLTGQFSWQNDVPHFNSPTATFKVPKAPQDQYKAFVDVKQVIYDGGITKAANAVELSQQSMQHQNLEVELYQVRAQVIQTYFLVLAIDEQLKQVDYRMEILKKRLFEIQSGVDNGMVLQCEADAFRVELLKLEQDRFAMEEGRRSAREILAELTGKEIPSDVSFTMPTSETAPQTLNRPELSLFDAQRLQLESAQKLTTQQRMPVIAGFGQLGYGNPGYNLLKDEFEPFYMVGLRLNWKIWDWKETARKKDVLQLQAQSVNAREAIFEKNIRLVSGDVKARIRQLERIMEKDDEIIALRKSITQSAQSRLTNGTYTAADYITDFNAESMAILAREMHHIELNRARREMQNILGY